MNHKKKLFWFT